MSGAGPLPLEFVQSATDLSQLPPAVHEVAVPPVQARVTGLPVNPYEELEEMLTPASIPKPSATSCPVLSGSSSDLSVTGLVKLVVSLLVSQTAASELYNAVDVSSSGTGLGMTGQTPSPASFMYARLAVPSAGTALANADATGRVPNTRPNPAVTTVIETAVKRARRRSEATATVSEGIAARSRTPTPALPPSPWTSPTPRAPSGVRTA